MMTVPGIVIDAIKGARSVLVTSHIVPDGDAIGSVLGLGLTLMEMGKKVFMAVDGGVPKNMTFLPGSSYILPDAEEIPDGLDLAVILDVGSYERIGDISRPAKNASSRVNIDHHATNSGFTEISWIDTSAPATGSMVADLIKGLGSGFSDASATAIFCAVSTDTGSFRYSNTNSDCFKLAAELIDAGADLHSVSTNVYESKPYGAIKGLGVVLSSIELRTGGRVAIMEITRDLMDEYSLSEGDVEGFISYGRSIDGVEVCVAFKELEDGIIKVGFRSKSIVDVSSVAARFGGGGHKRASGCTLGGGLEKVKTLIIEAVDSAVSEAYAHGRRDRDR